MLHSEDGAFEVESADIFPPVSQAQGGETQTDALPVSGHRDPGVSHHFEGVGRDDLAMSTLSPHPSQDRQYLPGQP